MIQLSTSNHQIRKLIDTSLDYQFNVCNSNNTSPIGRTKTIPSENEEVSDPVRLAVYSCSNYRKLKLGSFGIRGGC